MSELSRSEDDRDSAVVSISEDASPDFSLPKEASSAPNALSNEEVTLSTLKVKIRLLALLILSQYPCAYLLEVL